MDREITYTIWKLSFQLSGFLSPFSLFLDCFVPLLLWVLWDTCTWIYKVVLMIWLHCLCVRGSDWTFSATVLEWIFKNTDMFMSALNNISNLGPQYKACTVQYGTHVFHCLIPTCLSSFISHPTPLVQIYEPESFQNAPTCFMLPPKQNPPLAAGFWTSREIEQKRWGVER